MSQNISNPFSSVPCPMWRTGASTGRLEVDPETGDAKNPAIRKYGRDVGITGILVYALPPVLAVAGIQKEWRAQASTGQFLKEVAKRLFSGKANVFEIRGGLADGRGALGNGERGVQLDELERFAAKNGGAVNGEVRITRETFAAWQEQHFEKVGAGSEQGPMPESDKSVRRIELTLPFFLFPRTDAGFAGGKDYVTAKDVRAFWDPQNPSYPADFDSLKRDLSASGLFKAIRARKKLVGAPESAQTAAVGPGHSGGAAKSLRKAID